MGGAQKGGGSLTVWIAVNHNHASQLVDTESSDFVGSGVICAQDATLDDPIDAFVQ
jgi:hypothetical protein